MEFEYALSTNKPIISFLPKHPENIPSGKTDQDEEKKKCLEKFKELAKQKMIKYWENPENLGSVVSRSMVRLIKDFPAEGWVKSGNAIDEKSVKEIAKLQRENEELQKRLENIATEPPKDTEMLAQGEDKVEIEYSFVGFKIDHYNWERYDCKSAITFSWNQLFACIAPSMLDGCITYTIKSKLDELIAEKSSWKTTKEFSDLEKAEDFSILQTSSDLIIVQLRALGLIKIRDKKSVNDKTHWELTPYGDYVMTKLLARKKKN